METVEEVEPSEILTPDTDNATYFVPSEAKEPTRVPNDRTLNYKRMRLYNRNTWKDRREENKEVTHRQDNLAIIDALSGQLELTGWQKSKARRVYDKLELGQLGKPARLVAFGVCATVANDDVHDGSRYHPRMNEPDELFESLANDLEFTEGQLHSIVGVINHRRD